MFEVNGTNYYSSLPEYTAGSVPWVVIPETTLTSIKISGYGSGYEGSVLGGIEIDGVELVDQGIVDPNAKNIDSLIDTPTNYTADSGNNGGNYCVLNPLDKRDSPTYSEGNLQITGNGAAHCVGRSTFGVSSGKWYWEVLINSAIDSTYYPSPGICSMDTAIPNQLGDGTSGHAYMANGQKYTSGSLSSYGASFTQDDIIGFALDLDAGTLVAYKNGTSQGTMATGLTGSWSPSWNQYNSTSLVYNFGQRPFSISSVPTGFLSLCTANLPDPLIEDSSTAFDAKLWTGNGSSQSIATSFSPDFAWIKKRGGSGIARGHCLQDTVRGAGKTLESHTTSAEYADVNAVTAFNSNGLSIGSEARVNENNGTYVGWIWDAGANSSKTYTVTVVSDSGNKYRFDGHGTSAVTLDLEEGSTYVLISQIAATQVTLYASQPRLMERTVAAVSTPQA